MEGHDPRWVSVAGVRAAQRAWQRGEFSIDLLNTMAERYTQQLAKKPRVGGRHLSIIQPRVAEAARR